MTHRTMNYAQALFDLNVPEDSIKNTKVLILDNKELLDALSNPAVKKREKHAIIHNVFDKEVRNFIKVLCDNDAITSINEIFDAYENITLDSKNIIKAVFRYASRPNDDEIQKIKDMLCSKYNKKDVLLELKEDPSLIGGFILSVGNTEYDKSIKQTLFSLNKTLAWR